MTGLMVSPSNPVWRREGHHGYRPDASLRILAIGVSLFSEGGEAIVHGNCRILMNSFDFLFCCVPKNE
jgi:hypothetical protein